MGNLKTIVTFILTIAGALGMYLDTSVIANELKVPDTNGDIPALYSTVLGKAELHNKSVVEYVETCIEEPIFVPKNGQEYVGRLYIDRVGVDVAIYDSWKQSVCDAKDSACIFQYGTHRVIADHWNQGFDRIKQCKVGDIAYITDGNRTEQFICTSVLDGHNTDDGTLTDSEYNDFWNVKTEDLLMYTCNGNWRNIKIVIFEKC